MFPLIRRPVTFIAVLSMVKRIPEKDQLIWRISHYLQGFIRITTVGGSETS